MNKIVNKFLLPGDKFTPKMHLKQPRFIYSASEPFTKTKERIQDFKETGDTKYIYRNKLDKVCFQHDMAYGDFKDLARRADSDKILRDKTLNIAKNPNYDGYQRGLASMVYKFFHKKSAVSGVTTLANKSTLNNERPLGLDTQQLAEELHKPFIKICEKITGYSAFKDNIWGADLADMQTISKINKGFRFLSFLLDIFSKYAWVVSLNVLLLLMHLKNMK